MSEFRPLDNVSPSRTRVSYVFADLAGMASDFSRSAVSGGTSCSCAAHLSGSDPKATLW
jgi:hypothetical protein